MTVFRYYRTSKKNENSNIIYMNFIKVSYLLSDVNTWPNNNFNGKRSIILKQTIFPLYFLIHFYFITAVN